MGASANGRSDKEWIPPCGNGVGLLAESHGVSVTNGRILSSNGVGLHPKREFRDLGGMWLLGGDCGKSFGTKVHADSDGGPDVGVAAWIFGRISRAGRASSGFAECDPVRYGAAGRRSEHAGAGRADAFSSGSGGHACFR